MNIGFYQWILVCDNFVVRVTILVLEKTSGRELWFQDERLSSRSEAYLLWDSILSLLRKHVMERILDANLSFW